nr:MAG TPA: hypothetical protein [Caudoviricetes sp.]
MADFVSRSKVEFELCGGNLPEKYKEFIRRVLNDKNLVPSADVVSVVRCRSCKHWGDHVPFAGKKLGFNWCDKFCNNIAVESDFCSYGELRDGGDPDGR